MNAIRLFAAIGLLTAAVATAQTAGSDNAQQNARNATGNDAKAKDDKAAAEKARDLDLRYSEAMLGLARLELQRAMGINRQIPGTFTKTAIEALEQSVIVCEAQVEALKENKRIPLYLIAAEANAKAARQSLQRVLAINQQNPGTITPIEVERLRLTAELANLALEKARTIKPQNEAQFLQWQLDQLREDLFQLRNRVAQLSRLN